MANVTFYLMMRHESPFMVKPLKKVGNVKEGRECSALRIMPAGTSMFVAEYHDGILFKAHEAEESRLSKRSKKTRPSV